MGAVILALTGAIAIAVPISIYWYRHLTQRRPSADPPQTRMMDLVEEVAVRVKVLETSHSGLLVAFKKETEDAQKAWNSARSARAYVDRVRRESQPDDEDEPELELLDDDVLEFDAPIGDAEPVQPVSDRVVEDALDDVRRRTEALLAQGL